MSYFIRGHCGETFCWDTRRQAPEEGERRGKFYVWTVTRRGKTINRVACAKKKVAKKKAYARQKASRMKKLRSRVDCKDLITRRDALTELARKAREAGDDSKASGHELVLLGINAELEEQAKAPPPPEPTPDEIKAAQIVKLEASIKKWNRKLRLATTKLKKANKQLKRLKGA